MTRENSTKDVRAPRKRQPDTPRVAQKRERERAVLLQMIGIYCRGNHGMRRGELCPECAELAAYAEARVARCPRMETKTFCSQCPTHCYAAKQREAIRNVMRYSGPRMLLHHPVLTIKHGLDTLRARQAKQRASRARLPW